MDTATVAIGVGGILVTLDVLSLTIIYQLKGEVGEDSVARKRSNKAKALASEAHDRLDAVVDGADEDDLVPDGGKPPRDDETGKFLSPTSIHGLWERFTSWLPIGFDMDDLDGDTDGRTGFLSTYPEVHAVGWGLGIGLSLGLSLAYSKPVTMAVGAMAIRTVHYAHTGTLLDIAGGKLRLPKRYRSQIRREPQYLDAALGLGLVVSTAFVYFNGLGFWFA